MVPPHENQEEHDLSLDVGRYIRLPLRMMYLVLAAWSGLIWFYFDLKTEVDTTSKATKLTAETVSEDHRTIMLMHDDMLKLSDFADESKRMYNRYFRDYNDPDRKN